jgi:hypothetical protein
VICSYQRHHVLAGAIESLRAQVLPGGLEILVVDNSADQGKAAAFGADYAGVAGLHYICEPVSGLSHARNIGLARALAPIVAFMDDDARAEPGWAQAVLAGFAAFGPRAAALGGPVRPLWQSPRPDWLGDDLLGQLAMIDWGPAAHEVLPDRGIVGCNMALNRALALELGGFPCKLGRNGADVTLLSNEESALMALIRAAGRAIIYQPAAAVAHLVDPARLTQSWFRRRAAWQAVSDYIMDPAAQQCRALAAPPPYRPAAGDGEAETAADFSAAFWITYHATMTALAGGALPLVPAAGWQFRQRLARVNGRVFGLTQKNRALAQLGRLGLQGYRALKGR